MSNSQESKKLNIPLADWAKLTGIATLQDIEDLKEQIGDTGEDLGNCPTREEVTQQISEATEGLASEEFVTSAVSGLATEEFVSTKVAELVDSAPETLDTLRELAEALTENKDGVTVITEMVGENTKLINDLSSTVDSNKEEVLGKVDDLAVVVEDNKLELSSMVTELSNTVESDKTELSTKIDEATKDTVKYSTFAETRKTIQLANYDSISGITTAGSGVNLVMVSKWDKADFGSAQVPMNLNSTDGIVTINDDKIIATIDQIPSVPDVSNFVTTEAMEAAVAEVEGKIPTIPEDHVTKTELTEELSDVVRYIDYGDATPDRKSIALKNHDNISGSTVDGENVNIAMVSKWDKVDLGSAKVTMNLNTIDQVTINDEKVVATEDQIPDVSNLAETTYVDSKVEEISSKIDSIPVDTFALKEQVSQDIASAVAKVTLDSLGYVAPTVESLGAATSKSVEDLTTVVNNKIDASYVDSKVAELVDGAPETLDTLKELADALNDNKDGITALVEQIGSVDKKVDAITVDSLGAAHADHDHTLSDITDYVAPDLSNVVRYASYVDSRKTIQLANYDSISGITTAGDGVNLAMVSKWDKTDFGSSKLPMNLNSTDGIVTINDDKIIATIDDIPEKLPNPNALTINYNGLQAFTYDGSSAETGNFVVNLDTIPVSESDTTTAKKYIDDNTISESEVDAKIAQMDHFVTLPNKAINGIDFFKLTTDSSAEDIKAAMSFGGSLITEADLDKCLVKGYTIKEYTMQSGTIFIGFSGQGFTFTYVGFPNPSKDIIVKSIIVQVDDETDTYKVLKNGVSGTILTSSNIQDNTIISGLQKNLSSTSGDVEQLVSRMTAIEDQVSSLKKTNVVPVVVENASNVNQPDADLVLTAGEEAITQAMNVIAKSADVKSMNVESAVVSFKAESGDININNFTANGDIPKSTSNAQLKIQSSEYVKITSSDFNQTGYNCIEIGLDNGVTPPKNVIIDGIDFNAELSNNAILIFGHQDNAVITISNCHFASVSNAVRLSNRLNKRCTVNLINCVCDKWDTDPSWAGFLICQDYTSGSKEAEETNNLFAPDKVTINFINCYGPNGKIMASDPSDVCGTGNADTQVLYVWNSYGETVNYDVSRYPTVIFK